MNLYLLTQNSQEDRYAYRSCIVAASDSAKARKIHPSGNRHWDGVMWKDPRFQEETPEEETPDWASNPRKVRVRLVGVAVEGVQTGVLCASME